MNAVDFILREIAEATALYKVNKDEAEDKLDKIARNVAIAKFLPNSDKEKMFNAIEKARRVMIDGLTENVPDDVKVSHTGKSSKLRDMAKKFEQYNRDLHRKTQRMNHIIAGLQ
jgi:hypothetical protein